MLHHVMEVSISLRCRTTPMPHVTTQNYLSKLMYTAAFTSGLFLAACSCDEGCDVEAGGTAATSQVVGVDPGISSADVTGTPDSAMTAALAALKEKKISGFLMAVLPPEELGEMRAGWKSTRSEPVSAEDEEEFKSSMGMVTAEGAEETLFMMVQPHLKEVQEQMQGLSMMLPMMAAGALENMDVPPETNAMIGQLAAKLTELDVADEDKAREAIGVLVKAARALNLNSAADVKALSFEEVLGRADIAYAGLIDILGVYGLSPQKTLESMSVKRVSTEGDLAQMEMTFSLFGGEPQTVPFEMERLDGRWFPKQPKEEPEVSEVPASEASPQGLAR